MSSMKNIPRRISFSQLKYVFGETQYENLTLDMNLIITDMHIVELNKINLSTKIEDDKFFQNFSAFLLDIYLRFE